MFKGFFGKRRDYLMVTHEGLKDYRMYVGAREYGKHLDISWFLTVEPGFFKSFYVAMAKDMPGVPMLFQLDLFDQQDLRAYVTAVHRLAVKRAVESIAEQLGQDTSKFDSEEQGVLAGVVSVNGRQSRQNACSWGYKARFCVRCFAGLSVRFRERAQFCRRSSVRLSLSSVSNDWKHTLGC